MRILASRAAVAAGVVFLAAACSRSKGPGPGPAGLHVVVRVGGSALATVAPGPGASFELTTPAQLELDASGAVQWTYAPAADGVQVAVAGDSTSTAWKASLTLPDGVEAADLVLTGTAQDGSGVTFPLTFSATAASVAGAYHTGTYPDLFVELLGKSEAEVQAKIDAAWTQYFGAGADRVFYPVGTDMGYVLDVGNGDIRSEGMSYGMMLAVQLDHQDVFDALWRFARTYSQYASGPWQGYLAWQLSPTGPSYDRLGASNASDGEEWYATALFMASNRWGDGGAIDYHADAQALLDTMLHTTDRPAADRTVSPGDLTTNMFDAATHQVVFVADSSDATFTDPSYHLPHFYELWAAWADQDNDFWCAAAAASRAFLATAANPTTGLAPDYAQFDGAAYGPSWGTAHANFEYDAFRVGANVGVDHVWFDRDPWQRAEADRLLGFFDARGAGYAALWTLTGTPLGSGHGAGLTGTNAVLALASTSARLRTGFVQALWDAAPPTGQWRYYDGLLYTLALLEVSGNFRVWHPAGGPVAACP